MLLLARVHDTILVAIDMIILIVFSGLIPQKKFRRKRSLIVR